MIYRELIKHNIKAIIRDSLYEWRNLENLLTVASAIFIILNLVFFGYFLDSLIKLVYPDKDSVYILNSVLIFILVFDLFIRSLVQRLPKVDFFPYLILPVYRLHIIRYTIFKSFFSFLNLYLLFIIVPFLIRSDLSDYSMISVITYCIGFTLFMVINQLIINILNTLVQKRFLLSFIPFFVIMIFFTVMFGFNIPLGEKISVIFNLFFEGNIYVFAVLILIIIILFRLNILAFKLLISGERYCGEITTMSRRISGNFNFPGGRGLIIQWIKLELIMISRNKRTRQNIYYSLFFVFYSILFLLFNEIYWDSVFVEQLVYLIITGIFTFFHGQFMLSWESSFFDFIHTHIDVFVTYFKARYYLFLIANILSGLILLPAVLILKTDLYLFVSILVFNKGVINMLIIYNSIFNTGKIDLSRRAYANWQGTRPGHLILIPVIIVVPLIISYMLKYIASEFYVNAVFMFAGALVVLFNYKWINLIVKKFRERKYLNLEAFRM